MAYTVLDLHTFLSELIGAGKGDLEMFDQSGDQIDMAELEVDDGDSEQFVRLSVVE